MVLLASLDFSEPALADLDFLQYLPVHDVGWLVGMSDGMLVGVVGRRVGTLVGMATEGVAVMGNSVGVRVSPSCEHEEEDCDLADLQLLALLEPNTLW